MLIFRLSASVVLSPMMMTMIWRKEKTAKVPIYSSTKEALATLLRSRSITSMKRQKYSKNSISNRMHPQKYKK